MIEEAKLQKFLLAWVQAALTLGIELRINNRLLGIELPVAAFLPYFGGPKGMVIVPAQGPTFERDPALVEASRSAGVFCSFVNVDKYSAFNVQSFVDALRDWGYFGPDPKPAWMNS